MVDTHDGKEGHHCGKSAVSEAVCDSAKLEYVVSRCLVGSRVDVGRGANVVKEILGTHGVEILDQHCEHLYTMIDVLRIVEKWIQLGSGMTAPNHYDGIEALDVGPLAWLDGDPVGDHGKLIVGLVGDNLCQE